MCLTYYLHMDSLEEIRDLIKSNLVPELKQDLDSIPIERENFKVYHECLQLQLPFLYAWLQQQPNNFLWTGQAIERTQQEVQAYLLLLLCEITSPNSIYKLNQLEITNNAESILQNFGQLSKEVDDLIFQYYEEKLHKDKWKKQLGAVHGFVRYLKFRSSNVRDHDQNTNMNQKFLMFCLSVALNIRTCYETHYKTLSTSIFVIMLEQGSNDDIISMNIHSVIYDAVFKDIHIMDSIHFMEKQWNCLVKCLDFYKDFDSFTWNTLDDIMEVLLRNITLAPDTAASICLLKFVSKLVVYFTINRKAFDEIIENDWRYDGEMNKYRSLGITNTSYTGYRWAKSILQMFILESHKLMQAKEIGLKILQEIHKIYILAILPIALAIIEPHLITFLEKFISVLMETIKAYKYQGSAMQAITSLLETFRYHLQNPVDSIKLQQLKHNLNGLLKIEVFNKYTTTM